MSGHASDGLQKQLSDRLFQRSTAGAAGGSNLLGLWQQYKADLNSRISTAKPSATMQPVTSSSLFSVSDSSHSEEKSIASSLFDDSSDTSEKTTRSQVLKRVMSSPTYHNARQQQSQKLSSESTDAHENPREEIGSLRSRYDELLRARGLHTNIESEDRISASSLSHSSGSSTNNSGSVEDVIAAARRRMRCIREAEEQMQREILGERENVGDSWVSLMNPSRSQLFERFRTTHPTNIQLSHETSAIPSRSSDDNSIRIGKGSGDSFLRELEGSSPRQPDTVHSPVEVRRTATTATGTSATRTTTSTITPSSAAAAATISTSPAGVNGAGTAAGTSHAAGRVSSRNGDTATESTQLPTTVAAQRAESVAATAVQRENAGVSASSTPPVTEKLVRKLVEYIDITGDDALRNELSDSYLCELLSLSAIIERRIHKLVYGARQKRSP